MIRFNDLTNEQQEEFIKEYYSGGKVKEPLMALGVKENYKRIYEVFPPEVLEEKCEYCAKNLLKKRLARNNTNEEAHKASIYCPECNHRPQIEKCECEKCNNKPERLEAERREKIKEYWGKEFKKATIADLSFRERVFLGTILRVSSTDDMKTILPPNKANYKVVPNGGDFLWEMTNSISYPNTNALVPSTDAPVEQFVFDNQLLPTNYYPARMKYKLNIAKDSETSFFLSLTSPDYFNSKYALDAVNVWKEIAAYECIEYLDYQLELYDCRCDFGKKAKAVFLSLLKDFSVSQIYTIIWNRISIEISELYLQQNKALNEFEFKQIDGEDISTQFKRLCEEFGNMKKDVSVREDVANRIIQGCQQYSNIPDDNKMRMGHMGRIAELPQSEISSFFFNQVVKIGDDGFYHAPNMKDLGVS